MRLLPWKSWLLRLKAAFCPLKSPMIWVMADLFKQLIYMERRIIAGLLSLAGLVLFSCAKSGEQTPAEEISAEPTRTVVATASIDGQDTKTTYTDNGVGSSIDVDWATNDSFNAYYSGSSSVVFNTTDGTIFTADVPGGATSLKAVYGPVSYDGSEYTVSLGGQATGGVTETLANLASYDAMIAPEQADLENVHFAFAHQCAFLRIKLLRGTAASGNDTQEKTVSLTIKNCALNGNSGVNYEGWTYDSSNKILKIDITLSAALATSGEKTLYVAIPPLTYASGTPTGLEQGIAPAYTKTFTLSDGGLSFVAGKVYDTTISFTPAIMTASFKTPASKATYSSPTYTWAGSTSNLMDVFTFSNGELANYRTLKFTISNLVNGPVRLGYYIGDSWTQINAYYSAGEKDVDLSGLNVDLSKVTKISFGGQSGSGSVDILAKDVILVGDALVASFGSPSSNATYSFPTYNWSDSTNNLMNCFTFTGGELANYSKLVFNLESLTSNVRVNFQYGDNSTDNINISSDKSGSSAIFGSSGVKTITMTQVSTVLGTLGKTLADVKAIRFGGSTNTGSVNIRSAEMYLVK